MNPGNFGKPPRKGAQRDYNKMVKDTQERTTQQSDSPEPQYNNRIGANKSPKP
jgi:hypothetical protein